MNALSGSIPKPKRLQSNLKPVAGVFGVLIGILTTLPASAQSRPGTAYVGEVSATVSSAHSPPFWLAANRFGTVDTGSAALASRFAAVHVGRLSPGISYSFVSDLVMRASDHSAAFVQQLYGDLSAGAFLIRAGRKEETVGLVDSELSLGSMTLSGNAAPFTTVAVSLPGFVGIPGTGGFIGFRGFFGHGWMTGRRVVRHAYLHEKALFLQVGPVRGIRASGGLTHFAIWGGTHPDPEIGALPSGFDDFLRVVFAQKAKPDDAIFYEGENVLGNSLGAYDMRLDIVRPTFSLAVYRQFYFDDTVALRFRNKWDGLWGIVLRFPNRTTGIRTLLWEHVNTKQQGGLPGERLGSDNYYNHVLYGTGWTLQGRSLGNPLMITAEGFEGVVNNIVVAHHVGMAGGIGDRVRLRVMATYSRNYGVHTLLESGTLDRYETDLPLTRKDQFSLALDTRIVLRKQEGVSARLMVAYDQGDLLPDRNVGLTIGIRKEGAW